MSEQAPSATPIPTLLTTILEIGHDAAAKRWGVAGRTIISWRCGERAPAIAIGATIADQEGWNLDQVYRDLPCIKKRLTNASMAARG